MNLSGSSNSQHQFTLTAVNTSGVIATGTPITLGLLNTTSYQVATIDVTEFTTNTVTSNKSQQLFGTIKFVAGSKDATLNGFTLSKISGINIPNALTNVKVYKYGTQIGTVSITNDQIYITGLNIKIPSGSLLTLELRGDTVYIGDGSTTDDITLDISNRSDVSATEDTTGYSLAANINTTSSTIDLLPNHIMLTKNSTASKVVVPGASNVELLNINITSNSVFDITSFTLDGISGLLNTNNDTEETAQFTSLTFTVNGVDYDLLNTTQNGGTGTYTFATSADKFRVESGMPVNVRVVGNVKSTASI